MCLEIKGVDMTAQRQQKHNKMCLAIEKMKEEGRREEREKLAKAIEKKREKLAKAIEKEREKLAKAIEKEREKSIALNKAIDEERKKSSKALEEERKKGICILIATCRDLGASLEMACRQLMECYHLTQSEASAYLKEYYV